MDNVKRIEGRLVISMVGMAAFFVILFGIRASASIINPILLALVITITVLPIPSRLTKRGMPGWLALVLTITVTVDRLDQMNMLTRFTWTEWSRGKVLRHDENTWQGEHDGYKRLADPVNHRRTVISLPDDRWLIVDHLSAEQTHHYDLHWLLADADMESRSSCARQGMLLDSDCG